MARGGSEPPRPGAPPSNSTLAPARLHPHHGVGVKLWPVGQIWANIWPTRQNQDYYTAHVVITLLLTDVNIIITTFSGILLLLYSLALRKS